MYHSSLVQLAARLTLTQKVPGSTPGGGSKIFYSAIGSIYNIHIDAAPSSNGKRADFESVNLRSSRSGASSNKYCSHSIKAIHIIGNDEPEGRYLLGAPFLTIGPLVQLDRASVFETECRGFESLRDHQVNAAIAQLDRASVYETEG
jgi:hypothetical protein